MSTTTVTSAAVWVPVGASPRRAAEELYGAGEERLEGGGVRQVRVEAIGPYRVRGRQLAKPRTMAGVLHVPYRVRVRVTYR